MSSLQLDIPDHTDPPTSGTELAVSLLSFRFAAHACRRIQAP